MTGPRPLATSLTLVMTTLAMASIVLGACGFSPMYSNLNSGPGPDVESGLAQVTIARIPGREGQILRNKLVEQLYGGKPDAIQAYRLHVSPIREKRTELDITKDSDTTRVQLRLSTTMHLKRTGKSETILKRDITATTSYNVLASQFTTRVSEQNARKNAIQSLADNIERQLALYFQRNAGTKSEA